MTATTATAAITTPWNRVRVTGTLTLMTPLTLGDGTTRPGEKNDKGETPQVARVARAPDGRALIPGSSLKGVLSSYLREHNVADGIRETMFGRFAKPRDDATGKSSDSGRGGCVEFGFSYSQTTFTAKGMDEAVEQSVAIDRVTRTAADRQLFAYETVPAGTTFDVELLGFQMTADDLAALLLALNGFSDATSPVRLGSGTSNDNGRAAWQMAAVQVMTDGEIQNWLSDTAPVADYWTKSASPNIASLPQVTRAGRNVLRFDIILRFDGWFLVRDPHASKKKADANESEQKPPDAFPCLNDQEHVVDPARSFRGVFRSQVERIGRTLNGAAGGDPVRDAVPGLVEALFGYAGGRTVLQCSEFVDVIPSQNVMNPSKGLPPDVVNGKRRPLFPREFVAIDRFTGGAAEHLKFECVAAWQPVLEGFIAIDFADLQQRCRQVSSHRKGGIPITPAAALGLLFLTLRDLIEDDLAFGMGAAKGFGQCQGSVSGTLASGDRPTVEKLLNAGSAAATAGSPSATPADLFSDPWIESLAATCIEAARIWLKSSQGAKS